MRRSRKKIDPWNSHFRIYRNEHGGCQGWNVFVTLDGKRHSRYFPDSAHGSSELALQAAQDFAHRDIELHLEYLALRRRLKPRANTKSGIPGVARFKDTKRGDFWAGYFDDPESGTRKMKRFVVSQLGEDQARELAIEFRTDSMEPYVRRLAELEEALRWKSLS